MTAIELLIIESDFLLSSKIVTLASVLAFRKRLRGFEAVPIQLRRGRRALWVGLALHLA